MKLFNTIKNWFTIKEPDGAPKRFFKVSAKPVYVPPIPRANRGQIERVREIAKRYDYHEIDLQEINKMISFKRDDIRINVYYTTMTVGTCLKHPKQGKTQLFRRNVTWELMEKLFNTPRQHTGVGYHRKGSK